MADRPSMPPFGADRFRGVRLLCGEAVDSTGKSVSYNFVDDPGSASLLWPDWPVPDLPTLGEDQLTPEQFRREYEVSYGETRAERLHDHASHEATDD